MNIELFKISYNKIFTTNCFSFSYCQLNENDLSSLKSKFNKISDVYFSFLHNNEDKEEFLNKICKCQQIYFGLLKLKHIIDLKKSTIFNCDSDLSLNYKISSLSSTSKITLFENHTIYTFKVSDIINIINNSLSNHEKFIIKPVSIKNPYTNTNFTCSSIYNIFIFLNESRYIMPYLFHSFIYSNISIDKFVYKYETLINQYIMDNHINSLNNNELVKEIKKMIISKNKFLKINITIHNDFPINILIDCFKKYYVYHYTSIYYYNIHKRYNSYVLLNKKLIAFYKQYPLFGRVFLKSIKIFNKTKREIGYRTEFSNIDCINIDKLTLKEIKLSKSRFERNTSFYSSYLFDSDDDDDYDDYDSDYDY